MLSNTKKVIRNAIKKTVPYADSVILTGTAKHKANTLCLVRLDAIGDFIIWLDAARAYRELYPGYHITLFANASWASLAKGLPFWDVVVPVKVKDLAQNPVYRWKMIRRVADAGFEVAIQPTFSRMLRCGDTLIRASRAIQRIGSIGDLSNISARDKKISDQWYTRLLPAAPGAMMELLRNEEFVRHLGLTSFQARLPTLTKQVSLPDSLSIPQPYFVLFPGASWVGRQWSPGNYVELARSVYQKHGWAPVLCGGPDERSLCADIGSQLDMPFHNFAGQTTLDQLSEIIRRANFLIGNETSAIHIAVAVGTQSACILGGGHYGRFLPYPESCPGAKPVAIVEKTPCFNCNWLCTRDYVEGTTTPCVAAITVATVCQATSELMALIPPILL